MTLREQQSEIEQSARAVFGERVGQIIVSHNVVAVFPVKGDVRAGILSPLILIQHEQLSVPAALAALRILAVAADEPEAPAERARPLVEEHP